MCGAGNAGYVWVGGGVACSVVRVPVAGVALETGDGGSGRQGVGEGEFVRHGVLRITAVRGWGDRMETHMDHAWLMMRSHAKGETRVRSGELGAVEVGGDNDKGGGGGRGRPLAQQRTFQGLKGKGAAQQGPEDGPGSPECPHSPPLYPSGTLAATATGQVPVARTSCGG